MFITEENPEFQLQVSENRGAVAIKVHRGPKFLFTTFSGVRRGDLWTSGKEPLGSFMWHFGLSLHCLTLKLKGVYALIISDLSPFVIN